jgi:ABC-type transport system involved in multi-copper enzyme maturation permease subunit
MLSILKSLADPQLLVASLVLVLIQTACALPWLFALDPNGMKRTFTTRNGLLWTGGVVLGLTAVAALVIGYKAASADMKWYGRIYGMMLHLQLIADVFIVGLPWYLTVGLPWSLRVVGLVGKLGGVFTPIGNWYNALGTSVSKTGAVAQAAYKECWRQPMFWLIMLAGLLATWLAVAVPYFTFGDDYKMMKQVGFDLVLLAPLLFGTLAASISVSEEIEGRTAITVMSKPINRRSFLFGKYFGVLMACAAMALLLAANLNLALMANRAFDPINEDRVRDAELMSDQAKDGAKWVLTLASAGGTGPTALADGARIWLAESFTLAIGVLLGFGQVMILVAVATALATRLHFVVSLVSVLAVYLFGHLAPVVADATARYRGGNAGTALVGFLANVFNVFLPALEYFNLGPAIIRDTPLDLLPFALYSLTVFGYSVIYTAIVLVVGLLLFEDRDLS